MKLFYENAHWHGRGPLYKIGAKDIIEKWFLRASIGGYGWIKPPVGSNKWGFTVYKGHIWTLNIGPIALTLGKSIL